MEIKVLGSGSKGNCYRVTDGSTPLLLECGLPWREIQRKLDFNTDIAGCLISHEHGDHAKAAKDVMKAGIDIYATEGTLQAIGATGHRMNIITPDKQFTLGTWQILPFDVVHDAAEPVGYLMASGKDKLLFLTDTMYCRYKFQGVTHYMVECNYSLDILRANVDNGTITSDLKNRIIKSHMSLDTVRDFFKANDLSRTEEIHLIHLSDDNSHAERFKKEVQAITGKPVYIA